MLYPRETETREVVDLSGVWNFRLDNYVLDEEALSRPLDRSVQMAVPASYNDLTADQSIRDHIGWVWYERDIAVSRFWSGRKMILRFGSVTHEARVYINGEIVASHKGGYLPFEADITAYCEGLSSVRLSVAVGNVLDWTTLPPGDVIHFDDDTHPEGFKKQVYYHDFFNYAGIHRPVKLYILPEKHITSIRIHADYQKGAGILDYSVSLSAVSSRLEIEVVNRDGKVTAAADSLSDSLKVENPKLWNPGEPYLYTLRVKAFWDDDGYDVYNLPFGFRSVEIRDGKFLINGADFYFKGFGRHEDFSILGKGMNDALNIKDFSLLNWIGANSFRTSHYPYSEEMMDLADEQGIVIIDEAPAVGLWDQKKPVFAEGRIGEALLEHHRDVMRDLIDRDRHHPSVVMWSLVNEPASWEETSRKYFREIVQWTRDLDPHRPVCAVLHSPPADDRIGDLFDVIGVNMYPSWYQDPGALEVVAIQFAKYLNDWYRKYGKPLFVAEFGSETIAGMHSDPPLMFTEEYQCRMIGESFKAFDRIGFLIGEHLWNFADFATKQGITRAGGNRKGVFTRQREPKMSAHLLRKRWTGIGMGL